MIIQCRLAVLFCAVVSSFAPLVETAGPPSELWLDRSRGWAINLADKPYQGALAREITRQALLIAAREELRLTTHDTSLGEASPRQGNEIPLAVLCSAGEPSLLEIVRGFEAEQVPIWQQEIKLAGQPFDYPAFVTQMEALSRGEFLAVLKKAGFERRASTPAKPADAAVVAAIDDRIWQMNFFAQFSVIRQLHRQIDANGESPALMSQLAQGYANLGVLTEYFWNPMHEVFKARALLYAERLVVAEKSSLPALLTRG